MVDERERKKNAGGRCEAECDEARWDIFEFFVEGKKVSWTFYIHHQGNDNEH